MTATAHQIGQRRAATEVGIGLVVGFMLVAFMVSFASLIFTGEESQHLGLGVAVVLFAAAVHTLIGARWSSIPGVVVFPQDATTAVVATGLAGLLPSLAPGQRLGTLLAYGAVCTLAAAAVMLALGWFRLGRLVRFIPIPVIGGFLAGTGWLLVTGGADLATAGFSTAPVHLASLVAAVLFGAGLLVLLRRRPNVVVVPLVVGSALVLFFLALAATGTTLEEARHLGLLPATVSNGAPLPLSEVVEVDWSALGAGAGGIISVPFVATMGLLLNVGALDLMRGEDADLDRELRTVGFANLMTAAGGVPAGYHGLGPSSLGFRLGVASRTVPLVAAGVALVAAIGGPRLVALVPTPVVGALLLFLGLGFMTDWLVDRRRQMSGPEIVVMLTIVAIVALLGLVAAVVWGMVAAVILFVVAYSRLEPFRGVSTGRERRSTVGRSPAGAALLDEQGDRIRVAELQGYLFFGSCHALVEHLQEITDEVTEVLILDLRRVEGVDSTALVSFSKLARLTRRLSCRLILCDVPEALQRRLHHSLGQPGEDWTAVEDLDHALEAAENALLDRFEVAQPTCRELFGPVLWERLEPHLEKIEASVGEVIIEHGADEIGLVAVESGEVVTEIPVADGWRRVLRSGPGTVVGEMSLYRPGERTARVRTVERSLFYRLEKAAVDELERSHPMAAAELHRFLGRLMAERLAYGNEVIRSLLE